MVYVPDFYIGRTEVTAAQYDRFVAAKGAPHPLQYEVLDTWTRIGNDVSSYCGEWLSRITGRVFALLTEAQWKKAARGVDAEDTLGETTPLQ